MLQVVTLILPLLLSSSLAAKESSQTPASTPVSSHAKCFPAHHLFRLLTAEIALYRGVPEVALRNYNVVAQETQDPGVSERATQIALKVASLESAFLSAKMWATQAKNSLDAQITFAAIAIRLARPLEASDPLRHTAELAPSDAFQYYLLLYQQLLQAEDKKHLITALQQLADKPHCPLSVLLALTEMYFDQSENPKALKTSHLALQQDPKSLLGIQMHAEALFRVQGKEPTKAFLETVFRTNPTDAVKQLYAQFLLDNQYTQEAKAQIQQLVESPAGDAETLLRYAQVCIQSRWPDLAEKALLRCRKFSGHQETAHYFLAQLADMQQHIDKAVHWYQQVLTGPFHVPAHIRASLLLSHQLQYDRALTILERTAPKDALDQKQVTLAQSDILHKAKRYPQALRLLNQALHENPQDIELCYARSLVASQLNFVEVAEYDLKSILARNGEHIGALNALGYLLASKTNRLDEAQQYLHLALELSPHNASVLDSVGWLYYKKGDYTKAREILSKAVDITADADIAAHLGEVLWHMQDFETAKKIWQKALDQHPHHETIRHTMYKYLKKVAPSKKKNI